MEIEPGIRQMTIGREPFKGFPPPNAFLVYGSDASVLVDVGYDSEDDHRERMAYIADAGVPPVVELMITHRHPDHGGGAALYHQATGVPLTCHRLDREAIEKQRLEGRASIAGELCGVTEDDIVRPPLKQSCIVDLLQPEGEGVAVEWKAYMDSYPVDPTTSSQKGTTLLNAPWNPLWALGESVPQPPFYTLKMLGLFACDRLYTFNLPTKTLSSRRVRNHTQPCDRRKQPSKDEVRATLVAHLENAGYDVSTLRE